VRAVRRSLLEGAGLLLLLVGPWIALNVVASQLDASLAPGFDDAEQRIAPWMFVTAPIVAALAYRRAQASARLRRAALALTRSSESITDRSLHRLSGRERHRLQRGAVRARGALSPDAHGLRARHRVRADALAHRLGDARPGATEEVLALSRRYFALVVDAGA
jgi:hypothetical protein